MEIFDIDYHKWPFTTFFPLPGTFLMLQRQSSSVLRAHSLQEQGRASKYAE